MDIVSPTLERDYAEKLQTLLDRIDSLQSIIAELPPESGVSLSLNMYQDIFLNRSFPTEVKQALALLLDNLPCGQEFGNGIEVFTETLRALGRRVACPVEPSRNPFDALRLYNKVADFLEKIVYIVQAHRL